MVISIPHLKENHQKNSTLILELQRDAAFVEYADSGRVWLHYCTVDCATWEN